jgi:hypothetical protein
MTRRSVVGKPGPAAGFQAASTAALTVGGVPAGARFEKTATQTFPVFAAGGAGTPAVVVLVVTAYVAPPEHPAGGGKTLAGQGFVVAAVFVRYEPRSIVTSVSTSIPITLGTVTKTRENDDVLAPAVEVCPPAANIAVGADRTSKTTRMAERARICFT